MTMNVLHLTEVDPFDLDSSCDWCGATFTSGLIEGLLFYEVDGVNVSCEECLPLVGPERLA